MKGSNAQSPDTAYQDLLPAKPKLVNQITQRNMTTDATDTEHL